MRTDRTLGLAVLIVAWGLPIAHAQKGGKPRTADQPGTASLRCAGLEACGPPGFVVPDALTGDGREYTGVGDVISGTGAFLRSDGEFVLELRAGGGRTVYLNFSTQVAPPSGTFSRKTFTVATLDAFHLNTNVIEPTTGAVAVGGLQAIPLGQTWPSRIKAFWTDPYGVEYTIRFNPDDYPGSTHVWITRESQGSWTIESGHADVARLVSPPQSKKGRPGDLTDEGLYVLPFKLTLMVP